ncbi:uncharacterized protein [Apostichopus japonicus]|uniref:uncharacterized protein n=1 Tax=Stichopus japonicus TaxID=307972 RepID=UPI003AB69795
MIEWLKYNHSPNDQVKEYMRLTQAYIAAWLGQNRFDASLSQFITEYPRLLDTPGMIEQDFLLQFSPISLKVAWTSSLCKKVINYADYQNTEWQKKLGISGFQEDHVQNIAIQLLPLVLSSGNITNKHGKKVRSTNLDASRSFIEVKPVGTNLPQFIEDELKQDRTRKQPFVLTFGDRRNPTQSFVIIEGVALPATDLIADFDICFKSFYVFDIA